MPYNINQLEQAIKNQYRKIDKASQIIAKMRELIKVKTLMAADEATVEAELEEVLALPEE